MDQNHREFPLNQTVRNRRAGKQHRIKYESFVFGMFYAFIFFLKQIELTCDISLLRRFAAGFALFLLNIFQCADLFYFIPYAKLKLN